MPEITRRELIKKSGKGILACLAMSTGLAFPRVSKGAVLRPVKGKLGVKLSPYYVPLDSKTIKCVLCPRECEVDPGERGYCEVRENRDGKYYSLVYGNPCAVQVDPIEKKPLFHVLPGTKSFSIATAGCNLDCKFCQNWEISQARPEETFNFQLSPEQVVKLARKTRCATIASTYVEPTVFIEYMLDIGKLAGKSGIIKIYHSNGFIRPQPLKDLLKVLGAACIDLKGFTDKYYREVTEGELEPVLDTIKAIHNYGTHLELVNLVLPGKNDNMDEIKKMCQWIETNVGPDVPLHFSRFYPRYKLKHLPPTPIATLEKAREVALSVGLHYVYIGNVPGHEAENTYCPKCHEMLIHRVGYRIVKNTLKNGHCPNCGTKIAGIWSRKEVKWQM